LLFGGAFVFGVSRAIRDERIRVVASALAFLPAILCYLAYKPASFALADTYDLSTSQVIGLGSSLVVAYFYSRFSELARRSPQLALSIGDPGAIAALGGVQPDGAQGGPFGDGGEVHGAPGGPRAAHGPHDT
jgi:hypothetical protein